MFIIFWYERGVSTTSILDYLGLSSTSVYRNPDSQSPGWEGLGVTTCLGVGPVSRREWSLNLTYLPSLNLGSVILTLEDLSRELKDGDPKNLDGRKFRKDSEPTTRKRT